MEKTATCPKCNYVSPDAEFTLCPKCGIIIKKYYETLETRQTLEAERLERKKKAEEEAKLKAAQEATLREQKLQEEIRLREQQRQEAARCNEQERQEEERRKQVHSWKKAGAGGVAIVGVLLLLSGLLTDPSEGSSVNLHRLHIKQSLYTLGGVFLIISAINSGIDKILTALADIHTTIRKQNK